MGKVKVAAYSVSLDGFGAGVDQSLKSPLGERGEELHSWLFPTRMFQRMYGKGDGTLGIDNDFAERSFDNLGAWILGRNMFGPVRGPWPNEDWKGWWGTNPPYHVPVFVLTHHRREPLVMEGGTVFHFVTDGIESALEQAKEAANGKDVRIGGGAATIRQYLRAGLIDEMHVAISPVVLGAGEPFFAGMDLPKLGFNDVRVTYGTGAAHVVMKRNGTGFPDGVGV